MNPLFDLIYQPRPLSRQRPRPFVRGSSDGSLLSRRRAYRQEEKSRLFRIVVGFVFLLFAFRVGTVLPLVMHSPLGFDVMLQADGVHLPMAESGGRFQQSRVILLVTIGRDGVVEYNDERIAREDWSGYLSDHSIAVRHPWIALLIVDREIEMARVLDVMEAVKLAGYDEIVYATSPRDDTHL